MATGKSDSAPGDARLIVVIAAAMTLCSSVVMAAGTPAPEAPPRTEAIVRGVVRAVEQALISTDLTTRVAAIHVREGQSFNAGDKLVEFDCRRQLATVAAADAQKLEMQLAVDKNQLLMRTRSVGKNDLEVSEARLAKASAEADALRSQLDQCAVIAPFRGRVLELSLHVHETSQPGKPFIGLIASDNLEIDLIVPSHMLPRIPIGTEFSFRVDDVRKSVKAKVTRISPAVDPISQTIKIIAAILNEDESVLPGMSGIAHFMGAGE